MTDHTTTPDETAPALAPVSNQFAQLMWPGLRRATDESLAQLSDRFGSIWSDAQVALASVRAEALRRRIVELFPVQVTWARFAFDDAADEDDNIMVCEAVFGDDLAEIVPDDWFEIIGDADLADAADDVYELSGVPAILMHTETGVCFDATTGIAVSWCERAQPLPEEIRSAIGESQMAQMMRNM